MDMTSSPVNSIASQMTGDAVGSSMLKKVMDIQAQGAATLSSASAKNASPNLPPHLGQNVNTTA